MPPSLSDLAWKKPVVSKPRAFTLLVVPHSGDRTRRLRLPLWALQLLVVVILSAAAGLYWLSHDYLRLRADVVELAALRCENREQAEQIEALAQEAVEVQERLAAIDELDTQVRQMMGLPERKTADPAAPVRAFERFSRGGPAVPVSPSDIHATFRGALDSADSVQEVLVKLKEDVSQEQHRLAHIPTGWPVRGSISSRFGVRRSPYGGRQTEMHEGLDIAAPSGTAVKATGAGKVTFAGWYSGYGYMVIVDHGYGYATAYAHNSKLNVSVGKTVARGDVIAYVGSTGRSTGPHLHYEVRYLGQKKDPAKYL